MKKIIHKKNWDDLIVMSEKYKKIDTEELKERKKDAHNYTKSMNLEVSRILFRKFSSILHTVKLNWKNMYKSVGYDCEDCLSLDPPVCHPDSQDILETDACVGNSDLRYGRNMLDMESQAQFYIDLIARRNRRKKQQMISRDLNQP